MCDHEQNGCCQHQAVSSVHQTLDELDFERGIWSAVLDGDEGRVRQLLSKGTCVDATDNAGYTALHYAARKGSVRLCQVLLSAGASVNATTRAGAATPLHRAAMTGHKDVVELLLKHGADARFKDADGRTAADRAKDNNHVSVLTLLTPT